MFNNPPIIPRLINMLRVNKIPSGTTFASHRLIGHVFGPLFGYRWRVHAAWVNVNRNNKYYGTTNYFPEFGGHFRHFFEVRYDKCGKSVKDGLIKFRYTTRSSRFVSRRSVAEALTKCSLPHGIFATSKSPKYPASGRSGARV